MVARAKGWRDFLVRSLAVPMTHARALPLMRYVALAWRSVVGATYDLRRCRRGTRSSRTSGGRQGVDNRGIVTLARSSGGKHLQHPQILPLHDSGEAAAALDVHIKEGSQWNRSSPAPFLRYP